MQPDADIKLGVLKLKLCTLSVQVFLSGVCQSCHVRRSEAAEWYAARLQIADSEISAGLNVTGGRRQTACTLTGGTRISTSSEQLFDMPVCLSTDPLFHSDPFHVYTYRLCVIFLGWRLFFAFRALNTGNVRTKPINTAVTRIKQWPKSHDVTSFSKVIRSQ